MRSETIALVPACFNRTRCSAHSSHGGSADRCGDYRYASSGGESAADRGVSHAGWCANEVPGKRVASGDGKPNSKKSQSSGHERRKRIVSQTVL